jgi:DNA-binding protein HU-beta
MTKAELIEAVARSAELPKETVAGVIELTFEQISRALRKDKRFWVPGFGTFSIRRHKARRGANPRTKEPIIIPATRTVGFRPAPKLKKGI